MRHFFSEVRSFLISLGFQHPPAQKHKCVPQNKLIDAIAVANWENEQLEITVIFKNKSEKEVEKELHKLLRKIYVRFVADHITDHDTQDFRNAELRMGSDEVNDDVSSDEIGKLHG